MKKITFLYILISIISISFQIEVLENYDSYYNFIYQVDIGPEEEEKYFLIDTTRQSTYIFKNGKYKPKDDDEIYETNLEINTINIKNFDFELINNFLNIHDNSATHIDGIIGLGTINGKNDFFDQLKDNKLIRSKKIYLNLDPDDVSKKLKFQYEVPKNYGNDFYFCPLITYKSSFNKKYHETWMCEMTHILIKNEENEEDKNKAINLNDTYETMGKIIFNPNSNFITVPEIYLHYLKIQLSMNSRNRCSAYKNEDKIYLYCKYEDKENLEKLPYMGVLIEGYLHKIPIKYLFKKNDDGNYMSLIRFDKKNNKHHIWEFGLPIFQSFVIQLDFDNKRLGLGEPKLKSENLTSDWVQWYSLNEGLSPRLFASKMTMIIGLICFITIILFIFVCGVFTYFNRYYRRKSAFNEEIEKQIEMVNKK